MISFRYHVVSIVAVLVALAAGVALGGGPLSDLGRGTGGGATKRAEARNEELTRQLDEATTTEAFSDQFATLTASGAVEGRLARRPVSIVTLPGADDTVVDSLAQIVQYAGGAVSGTYAVQPDLIDGSEKALVDQLGSQLVETVKGATIPAAASTYERMGLLIGRGIATTTDAGDSVDNGATEILSGLKAAELLRESDGGAVRGSLVLVVLSDEPSGDTDIDKILRGLFTGLAAQSDGVVVAGTTGSADDGVLKELRDDVNFSSNVSSADSSQTTVGRVAAVLALSADMSGDVGHYGAVGIDGPLPRG